MRKSGLLAALGLGAVIQYFADPKQGDRRRHVLYDKIRKALRISAREAHGAVENARNHTMGAVHELRNRLADAAADDIVLVDRVRAELGHHVERARAIEVVAESGRVTLTGAVGAGEGEKAAATALAVPGVRSVDNQLSEGMTERG